MQHHVRSQFRPIFFNGLRHVHCRKLHHYDGNTTSTNATYYPLNAFSTLRTWTGNAHYWQIAAYNANDSHNPFYVNVQGLVAYDASMKCTMALAYSCDPPQHERIIEYLCGGTALT